MSIVDRENNTAAYTMQGQTQTATEEERDIGVLVTSDLKPT